MAQKQMLPKAPWKSIDWPPSWPKIPIPKPSSRWPKNIEKSACGRKPQASWKTV